MKNIRMTLVAAVMIIGVTPLGAWAEVRTPTGMAISGDAVYQIVKADTDRVWRLNTRTGEIAVCTLVENSPICTTSSDVGTPPSRSYDQLQADAKARRDTDMARDLAFLDTILQSFKSLIKAAMVRERVATVE